MAPELTHPTSTPSSTSTLPPSYAPILPSPRLFRPAAQDPASTSTYKLGNIAQSAPDSLYGPGWWALAGGIRRTFVIVERPTLHLTFQAEGDVINATNSTFFNLASGATGWNNNCSPQSTSSNCNLAYGTIGGQNLQPAVAPRDWQLQGRFRF